MLESSGNISIKKPPIAKFMGNAKKSLMYMAPDTLNDLKREKGSFYTKNQIDGEGIQVKKITR